MVAEAFKTPFPMPPVNYGEHVEGGHAVELTCIDSRAVKHDFAHLMAGFALIEHLFFLEKTASCDGVFFQKHDETVVTYVDFDLVGAGHDATSDLHRFPEVV